jgi:uncharacterized membrane protein YcaP (DUF421 family)
VEIVVRATVLYFFVFILLKIMGKKELSGLSAFELILLITIGDLIQQGITQDDTSMSGSILAVATIALWVMLLSYVSFKWAGARKLIEGVPVVVVQDGKILEEAMKIQRLHEDELMEQARHEGIEDLADLRFAVLESDGKFSFVKKDA